MLSKGNVSNKNSPTRKKISKVNSPILLEESSPISPFSKGKLDKAADNLLFGLNTFETME